MKKNNMFRIASVLLVAVLLSTCVISGAFAKYTASAEAKDTARVAKFGITVEAGEGDGIFAKTYDADSDYAGLAVDAQTDVVAPGTEGTLAAFQIKGTAEVAVAVKVEATDLTLSNWMIDANTFYCPIVIKVGDDSFDFSECDSDTVGTKIQAVKDAIAAYSQDIAANDTVATKSNFGVTWSWAFETLDSGVADAEIDEKDTKLGRLLADDNSDNDPTIKLNVKITVDQID